MITLLHTGTGGQCLRSSAEMLLHTALIFRTLSLMHRDQITDKVLDRTDITVILLPAKADFSNAISNKH